MEKQEFALVQTGSWDDVVEFSEQLSEVLTHLVPPDVHQSYEEWRPRHKEQERELRERTADESSIQERQIERDSEGTQKELGHVKESVMHSGHDLMNGDARHGVKDMEDAGRSAARGLIPLLLRLIRDLERGIYLHIIGRTNPNYFESRPFSISIEHKFRNEGEYVARVVFADRAMLDRVNELLAERV